MAQGWIPREGSPAGSVVQQAEYPVLPVGHIPLHIPVALTGSPSTYAARWRTWRVRGCDLLSLCGREDKPSAYAIKRTPSPEQGSCHEVSAYNYSYMLTLRLCEREHSDTNCYARPGVAVPDLKHTPSTAQGTYRLVVVVVADVLMVANVTEL